MSYEPTSIQLDPYLFVKIISYLPYFYQHVFKRVSKNIYEAVTNHHHDSIMENYNTKSSLEIHDFKLVELNDYFKYKLHFKMQDPIEIATVLKKMYYLDDPKLKWMDKYRDVEKYLSILKNKHCLKINITLIGCDVVTCQYLNTLEKQFKDHSLFSVDFYFSHFHLSDAWQYNFSCRCLETSASHRVSRFYNEGSRTRINKKSPKITSVEGFEMYFKKCADNLGICISLLPRPAIISHQLFVTTFPLNVDLDWNQALFVFRNKIISTCEPTLLAPTLNSMDKYETCSVYSFLFKPVKKLALDTYLRTKKPKLFINEYQAFLKHELVLNCLDRFQVLLKIAQENTYEVQFILSKQFSTTPLYILEELDALTISKHKELCKQLSLIPPKSSNNAIKKKQLKTLEEQQQEKDLSFKNFKLFNWRNDLLLKTLNISEEEFHNMKRKEQHRESRATKDSSSSQKKNHSGSNHPMAILGDFNTCKDYYYNDYYYSHPYYEEDDE